MATLEELKRLWKAGTVDDELFSEFEAYEFESKTHGEECRIGGYSPEIAPYLAYAANHAVEIAERERGMVDRLVEALSLLIGTVRRDYRDGFFANFDALLAEVEQMRK